MNRRSFFAAAAVTPLAAIVGSREVAAQRQSETRVAKTAVSVEPICFGNYGAEVDIEVELPDGFIPRAVKMVAGGGGSPIDCVELKVIDQDGVVLDVLGAAFEVGALDLRRDVVGKMRVVVRDYSSFAVMPMPLVTIYGDIEQQA